MDLLDVVFLNCRWLGGPADKTDGLLAEDQRIPALTDMLRDACSGAKPAIVGLCEVCDRQAGENVARGVLDIPSGSPNTLWAPGSQKAPQSLLVVYDPERLETVGEPSLFPPLAGGRPWVLGQQFRPQSALARPFFAALCHLKSQVGGDAATDSQRLEAVNYLAQVYRDMLAPERAPLIAFGDMNCEPFSMPLAGLAQGSVFRAVRERKLLLEHTSSTKQLFYNPTWRLLAEPELVEEEWTRRSTERLARPGPTRRGLRAPGTGKPWISALSAGNA